jgi:hypothetical protein
MRTSIVEVIIGDDIENPYTSDAVTDYRWRKYKKMLLKNLKDGFTESDCFVFVNPNAENTRYYANGRKLIGQGEIRNKLEKITLETWDLHVKPYLKETEPT